MAMTSVEYLFSLLETDEPECSLLLNVEDTKAPTRAKDGPVKTRRQCLTPSVRITFLFFLGANRKQSIARK
jgi:hypothetical protein